jgi:hypothetical protein
MFASRRFVALIFFILIIIGAGVYTVELRRPIADISSSESWASGDTGYIHPLSEYSSPTHTDKSIGTSPEAIPVTIPNQIGFPVQTQPESRTEASDALQDLLRDIKRSGDSSSLQSKTARPSPEDNVSVSPPIVPSLLSDTKTPEQQELFQYGNEIGKRIREFSHTHTNMLTIVADQAKDRENEQKNAALRRLGTEYAQLGTDIAGMGGVPDSMKSAHDRIAKTYQALGIALAAVPDAQEDTAFVSAITAYNNLVEQNITALVTAATLFGLKDVVFAETDPGALFSFRGT